MNYNQRYSASIKNTNKTPNIRQLFGLFIFAGACIWISCFSANKWFPLIDDLNLAIHEAGHPLMGVFSSHLSVYGGTLLQLCFPLFFAYYFSRNNDFSGVAFSYIWFNQSLFNVARYIDDARSQLLPLLGGGNHDWTEILTRWNLLNYEHMVADILRRIATVFIIYTVYRSFLSWKASRSQT